LLCLKTNVDSNEYWTNQKTAARLQIRLLSACRLSICRVSSVGLTFVRPILKGLKLSAIFLSHFVT